MNEHGRRVRCGGSDPPKADVYASSPLIVADMRGILQGQRPPEKRTKELEVLVSKAGGMYWRLRAPAK